MKCPNLNFAAISVGTPIPMVSVQQKANNVMCAVATTTTLYCASKRNAGNPGKTDGEEATSQTSASQAMDVTPAIPHVGIATEAIACVVIPGPHPTALPMVHPQGTPLIPKCAPHHPGTSRTL